jgi:hypothetical protein
MIYLKFVDYWTKLDSFFNTKMEGNLISSHSQNGGDSGGSSSPRLRGGS